MAKQKPKTFQLGSKLIFSAFTALKEAGGNMKAKDVVEKAGSKVELDDWANYVFEKTGYTRWKSLLHFYSINCVKAGYIKKENRVWYLTSEGEKAIELGPDKLLETAGILYRKWKKEQKLNAGGADEDVSIEDVDAESNPYENISKGYKQINDDLAVELLDNIANSSPTFFEHLVMKLLLAMGYGSSLQNSGRVTQQSADGGIDGVIDEDKLGLDQVYIQAKRWQGSVGSQEIQMFSGALAQHGANKGVFITTSRYTANAIKFVEDYSKSGKKIVLIDGVKLAKLMIENNVGVFIAEKFEVRKVDLDFFDEIE